MPQQLIRNPEDARRICRAIEAQRQELDLLILREPTGYPRTELTAANIHLLAALDHLKEIC